MKTPEEVADLAMMAFTITYEEDVQEQSAEYIREQIVAAIEADREQRKITGAQYDKIIEAIDRAKTDDDSLDSDEYASIVVEALGLPVESYAEQFGVKPADVTWPDAQPELEDFVNLVTYRSDFDDAIVVEVDTNQDTGDLRIVLNDGVIWHGDPESTTSDKTLLGLLADSWRTGEANIYTQGGRALDFHARAGKILRDAGLIQ